MGKRLRVNRYVYLILLSLLISCSSDDPTSEVIEEEENIPIETRKFVSKIHYDSSDGGTDVFNYNYDGNNNLISIEKNDALVSFSYDGNRITRVEITDNSTGEILNYMNYFYNSDGLLDYLEGDYLRKVVKFIYDNDRVIRIYRYNSITDFDNDQYVRLIDVMYGDDTNNVIEYKDYNFNGDLIRRGTRSYGLENKRYFGEAAALIDLPSGNNIVESFNYYSNYNLKSWKTNFSTNELELYRESFFENDADGFCLNWDLVYYNTATGEITTTFNKFYEYIELEIN